MLHACALFLGAPLRLVSFGCYVSKTLLTTYFSHIGGHNFLRSDHNNQQNNEPVHTISTIFKRVMASTAEAKIGGLCVNARAAIPARHTLEEVGQRQPKTPIQTENTTADRFENNNIIPKATKFIDMNWNWLKDREAQEQFRFYWRPGSNILAD